MKTPQQILGQSREDFEKKFDGIYYGKDFDGLPNYPPEGFKEDVFNWHTSTLQAFIEAEIARLEGMKKETNPKNKDGSYKHENQATDRWLVRRAYNLALQDQITHFKLLTKR